MSAATDNLEELKQQFIVDVPPPKPVTVAEALEQAAKLAESWGDSLGIREEFGKEVVYRPNGPVIAAEIRKLKLKLVSAEEFDAR